MDTAKWLGLVFAIVLIGGSAALMLRSWRRRQRRDGAMRLGAEAFALGEPRFSGELLHLATTPAGEPLNRLAAAPLDYRARGRLELGAAGLHWSAPGGELYLEAERIDRVDTASWTIDRAVEPDGLIRLGWRSADEPAVALESYFRATSPSEASALLEALHQLTTTTPRHTPGDS